MGFYHGLSGLNASSKNLDVIGHNIANSNTTGFKSSRAEFNEMVASAMGASSGNNAGIGVSVAAVSQQFSQGVIVPTKNGLDMAINGDGFFVVQTVSGSEAFTRSGNFKLDKNGFLITVNGDKVMGNALDPATGLPTATRAPISFPSTGGIPAKQTTTVSANLNLDSRTADGAERIANGTSLQVFDSLGNPHPVSLYFEKPSTPGSTPGVGNTWNVYDGLAPSGKMIGTVTFDTSGKFVSSAAVTGVDALGNPILTPGSLKIDVTASGGAAATPPTFPVSIDLSKATQFGSAFSVSKLKQDGYAPGELTGVNVSADGTLVASYSNGETRAEAQLTLARFTNTQGLSPAGNNNWEWTADAGPTIYGNAQSGSFGDIQGNALEESNVDLTAELVGMMTAQRAYQANAQTIKTQDQIFSTLVNLR